jgi:hypothetical protein
MATNITISTGGTTTVVTVPEKQNTISVFQNQFTTAEQNKLAGIEAGATTDQVLTEGTNINVVESNGDYTINLDDSVSLSGTLSVTGGINGDVTGDVTGNLTGNVTGDVTGNVSGNAGTVTNGLYTTSSIGDLSDVSTSGIGDDNVLVSDGSGNFTPKSTFEAFLSSAAQYNTDVSGPLPGIGGDINGDGIVNTADLLAFLASFGTNINLDGYVKALFTTDGSFVDLQENNPLTQLDYNSQSSNGIANLKTLDLTAPTDSDNYGSFTWTHNAQNDTVDFLSGVNATDWHLDSKIILQDTCRIQVDLGTNFETWLAIYMHIVNEYPTDPDRTFTVNLGQISYVFESDGFIDIPPGVVSASMSLGNISNQEKFFVTSTANNQRPTNIKISLHAGCRNDQGNGHVKLKVTDFKFKISN